MAGTEFRVEIQPIIPARLARLEELANDLYYSWDRSVRGLFRHLDPDCWRSCAHNPKLFLRRVPQARLDDAAQDPMFLAEYARALSAYDIYLQERPREAFEDYLPHEDDLVAYFSAEFGFHQSMPIYAGGLGILAADYCKAMSHLRMPFVGVGLLYHQGYFTQRLLIDGSQQAEYTDRDPEDLPVSPALDRDGEPVRVAIPVEERQVMLQVWLAKAGHIRLYLLDSDLPENGPEDRHITYQLYGGDTVNRIRQEMVLGMGGVRALRALGVTPTVWHINEGHSAFQILERCREQVAGGLDFASAVERVAGDTVFTTHTPVPAGHDIFDHDQLGRQLKGFLAELGASPAEVMALGRYPDNPRGFNMTALALRGSRFHNGVSRIHGGVAAEMARYLWPDVPVTENPVGYVTNGVDISTFLGMPWMALFDMYLDGGWRARLTDEAFWHRFVDSIPSHVYRSVHQILKEDMLNDCRRRVAIQYRRPGCSEALAKRMEDALSPDRLGTLVIGFARRFATYKRATLLFRDLERLARLVNRPDQPVMFIFAGKAHPDDEPGQAMIREIQQVSMRPEFLGRIILLEDYNFSMARSLLPGVDLWLNVPEYPKEACGTSGMKAAINGVANLSVLDGWWGEAFDGHNGWAITPHPELDPEARDREEAAQLMDILEQQVIPTYFDRRRDGDHRDWISISKATMKSTIPRFNSQRMAQDYLRGFYAPAAAHGRRLAAEENTAARELTQWKTRVCEAWPGVSARLASTPPAAVSTRDRLLLEVDVELNGLRPEEVQVECLIGAEDAFGEFVSDHHVILKPVPGGPHPGRYACDMCAGDTGLLLAGLTCYKLRVYPSHPLLAHRFEHGCMYWL